jgi:hypothetical protein
VELTEPGQNGWAFLYTVRRDDGRDVLVEASCTETAAAAANEKDNTHALEIIKDLGGREAIRLAENAMDRPGQIFVHLGFDPLTGSPRSSYKYPDE